MSYGLSRVHRLPGVPLPDENDIRECKTFQHPWDRYQSEVESRTKLVVISWRCTRCTAEKHCSYDRHGTLLLTDRRYPDNWESVSFGRGNKAIARAEFIEMIAPLPKTVIAPIGSARKRRGKTKANV